MDTQTYSFILSMASAIIMLMLGIVSFFIKGLISSSKSIERSVNQLNITIATEKTRSEDFRTSCNQTHQVVNERLNDHSRLLKDHEKRLTHQEAKR